MTTTTKTATNNFKVDTAMNSAEDNTATGTEVAENKKARKPYSINPVIDEDRPVKFNHVDICIENDVLKISGMFDCWKPETAYRRFRKIMAQVATEVPKLEGWDEWEPAKKLTFDETEKIWLNENDEMIFDTKYTTNILNVDINEDTIYIWGTFYTTAEAYRAAHPEEPNCNIELEADNTATVEDKPTETREGDWEISNKLTRKLNRNVRLSNYMEVITQDGERTFVNFRAPHVEPDGNTDHGFTFYHYDTVLGTYETREQTETVINLIKAAIERGEEKFIFPTVDELNQPSKADLRGSLERAMEIARQKYHEYEREGDDAGMNYEKELLTMYVNAIKELEAA